MSNWCGIILENSKALLRPSHSHSVAPMVSISDTHLRITHRMFFLPTSNVLHESWSELHSTNTRASLNYSLLIFPSSSYIFLLGRHSISHSLCWNFLASSLDNTVLFTLINLKRFFQFKLWHDYELINLFRKTLVFIYV